MIYELSYWESESFLKNIDAAIIGSGLVGLTAALQLRERHPNWRIAIFERGGMPIGASTRNAGFACFGSMTELLDDMQQMPADEVWQIVERRWKGLQRLRQITGDSAIEFFQHGGYEMFTAADRESLEQCRDKMAEFNQAVTAITGHPEVYRMADEKINQSGFAGVEHLIVNQAEGQIHTGKMMQALLQKAQEAGILFFNGIDITAIQDSGRNAVLHTAHGWEVEAAQVLVCANGFARQLLPELAVIPARNQVLITEIIPGLRVQGCFHYDRGYFYFRNIDGRILLGGGRHLDFEGETTTAFGANENIRPALELLLREVICPGQTIAIDRWWTGIMGIGPVKKPIVQRISDHIAVAVRLNGMGVAIGALVGAEGADLVSEG